MSFLDCPHCYNLVQDAANEIRLGLANLADTLENINTNPNVADDEDFVQQLEELSDKIDDLHQQAMGLQRE